jgi:hypothetical protein
MLYGGINIILILLLLTLIIFLYNDIYILGRIGFVIFVGVHLFLLFFIKIQYLCIFYDEAKQKIEFHYNKKFGWKWRQKVRTVLLPMKQFNGYKLSTDSMGISVISFYKLEQKEQYELGPFHVGIMSNKEKQNLENAFGKALKTDG